MSKLFFSCHGMSGQNIPCHGMCGCFFSYQGMSGQNQPNRPSWAAYSPAKCRKWSALVFDRASNQTNHPECSTLKQNPDRQTGRQTDRQTDNQTHRQADRHRWPKTITRTAHSHCAPAIFRSGPNICFPEPPGSHFKAFLTPGPKPLPERFIFIAREPFFGLDRISGFWNLQKAVLKHFWFLAQNYCQNGSKTWRANYF